MDSKKTLNINELCYCYNELIYRYSINPLSLEVKPPLLVLIKKLNHKLHVEKTPSTQLRSLCESSLLFYEKLKRKQSFLDLDGRLLYISSKIKGSYFFPYNISLNLPIPIPISSSSPQNFQITKLPINLPSPPFLLQSKLPNCSCVSSLTSVLLHSSPTVVRRSTLTQSSFTYMFTVNGVERFVTIDIVNLPKDNISFLIERSLLHLQGWSTKLSISQIVDEYPGSDYSTDCYLLSGFLPQPQLVSSVTMSSLEYLQEHWHNGDIVMGLGTGDLSIAESRVYNLLPFHDYAVSDLNITDGFLKLVDNGKERRADISELNRFHTVYVNWDSLSYGLDKVVKKSFFVWKGSRELQYSLSLREDGKVWCLIEKHLGPEKNSTLDCKLIVSWYKNEYEDGGSILDFSTNPVIDSFITNDTRFSFGQMSLKQGCYNSVISINDTRLKKGDNQFYTMTLYSDVNIKLEKANNIDEKRIEGFWSKSNSGGNNTSTNYLNNPMFELKIDGDADIDKVLVGIVTNTKTTPVNLGVYKSHSDFFLIDINEGNRVIKDSAYDLGSQFKEVILQKGVRYILVPSAFGEEDFDSFKIVVKYNNIIKFERIYGSLGLFTKEKLVAPNGTWNFKLKRSSTLMIKIISQGRLGAKLLCSGEIVHDIPVQQYKYGLFFGSIKNNIYRGIYQLVLVCQTPAKVLIGSSVEIEDA